MDVIKNEQEYLQRRGFANDRLTQAHQQIQAEKNKGSDQALREIFEQTDSYQAKLTKWHSDRDNYRSQNLPMTFILKKFNEYQAEIENDFQTFKEDRTKR